jgi:hypothetical protein
MSSSTIDPVAQTFIIDGQNFPSGAFLSSVNLFFRTKPLTSVPVRVCILPTLNGYPTGQPLQYSIVSLPSTSVNVSETPHYLNSNTYTNFAFSSPVYINPDQLYAIVVQSSSDDYTLWCSQQGDTALLSTSKALPTDVNPPSPTKIVTTPYVGDLFESQNGLTWTADLLKDLMFTINRCKFDTNTSPSMSFVVPAGLPERRSVESDTSLATANSIYDVFNLSTTDLTPPGTSLSYQYTTTLGSGTSDGPYSVVPGKYGTPKSEDISLNDNKGSRVLNYTANDSFKLQATLSTDNDAVSPVISEDGLNLWTIRYRINNMGISNDDIFLITGGIGYLANANGTISYPEITVSAPDLDGGEQAYVSANIQSGNIVSVYVTSEGSGYLTTPTITISNTSNVSANVVVAGETSPTGGNGRARYITQIVTLAEGSDSGDLRVYTSAYRPTNSDIHVYYKIVARDDTQKIEEGDWKLMTITSGAGRYSTSFSDIVEYEFSPGTLNVADEFVSYTSKANGLSYTSFYQFMIKVVMSSSDSTFAPFLDDIRAIALPPGTGL